MPEQPKFSVTEMALAITEVKKAYPASMHKDLCNRILELTHAFPTGSPIEGIPWNRELIWNAARLAADTLLLEDQL
jgi:hypothetical protein